MTECNMRRDERVETPVAEGSTNETRKVRVIEVKESVFHQNDVEAEALRAELSQKGVFMMNVMSSPGSGKTTALCALVNRLKEHLRIGVMDVDIETSLDASCVAEATGVKSLQIHNGGLCHIDAEMTKRAIDAFGVEDLDLVILENIGNLVCPAEFDTGSHMSMMLLSVPEGDDKPLKYPLMFSVCDLIVISKIDTLEFFDFSLEKATANIRALNPNATILTISAKTGEGMDVLADYVMKRVKG